MVETSLYPQFIDLQNLQNDIYSRCGCYNNSRLPSIDIYGDSGFRVISMVLRGGVVTNVGDFVMAWRGRGQPDNVASLVGSCSVHS
jgi:hypothetical protein